MVIVVALRLYIKLLISKSFGANDVLTILATVSPASVLQLAACSD